MRHFVERNRFGVVTAQSDIRLLAAFWLGTLRIAFSLNKLIFLKRSFRTITIVYFHKTYFSSDQQIIKSIGKTNLRKIKLCSDIKRSQTTKCIMFSHSMSITCFFHGICADSVCRRSNNHATRFDPSFCWELVGWLAHIDLLLSLVVYSSAVMTTRVFEMIDQEYWTRRSGSIVSPATVMTRAIKKTKHFFFEDRNRSIKKWGE